MSRSLTILLWLASVSVLIFLSVISFLLIKGDLAIVVNGDDNLTGEQTESIDANKMDYMDEAIEVDNNESSITTQNNEERENANKAFIETVLEYRIMINQAYSGVETAIEKDEEVYAALDELRSVANKFQNELQTYSPSEDNISYAENLWNEVISVREKSQMLKRQYEIIGVNGIRKYNELPTHIENIDYAADELEGIYQNY